MAHDEAINGNLPAPSRHDSLPAQHPSTEEVDHELDTARATLNQQLGLDPQTVVIQPPAPPPPPPSGQAQDRTVTRRQLAEQLQVSERTVDRWSDEGVLPAPIRQGRGRMSTLYPADAAALFWDEQGEESRKVRRSRQRHRKSRSNSSLTHEARRRKQ